jgi:hypothetical protein
VKLIDKKTIFLTICDGIISVVTWVSVIYLYNAFGEFPLDFQTLKSPSYARLINGSIIFYILLTYSLRILFSYYLKFKKEGNVILTIVLVYSIVSLMFFYLTSPHSTRAWVIVILYLVLLFIFSLIWLYLLKWFINKKDVLIKFLPPVILDKLPKIKDYFEEKPSAYFIIVFMILLILCAFLLIFKQEWLAEQLANIAYFCLVIGVGIEFYKMVKNPND